MLEYEFNNRTEYFYNILLWGALLIFLYACEKDEPAEIPSVNTLPVKSIESIRVKSGGKVIDDGGAFVTDRGVVWCQYNAEPTLQNRAGMTANGTGEGQFTSYLFGLLPETKYYLRAYAINIAGTAYGEIFSFETLPDDGYQKPNQSVIDIEGNHYKTVKIGDQEWMAENLRTTTYRYGTPIPNVKDNSEWSKLSTGAYIWFGNDESNADIYGALYNWYAVNTDELCPLGWRVPTDDDWKELEGFVDSKYGIGDSEWNDLYLRGYDAGKKLKSASGWFDNGSGTDDYGFSAFPGGYRGSDGRFHSAGFNGYWWTYTESYNNQAWRRVMYHEFSAVNRCSSDKQPAYSVRCVKDMDDVD